MAWWGNSTPVTYADHVRQMGGDGKLIPMVELLEEYSPLVHDMIHLEANETGAHRGVVRTGYPAATWRKLNQGVQPTKASSAPVTDTMGNLEAYAEVDKQIADTNGNTSMFRMGEAAAHIEGMTQTMETNFFYGNETTPEKFIGLTPRFDVVAAQTGSQIKLAGGAGADNQSVWFVTWDPRTCHGIFPKGDTMAAGGGSENGNAVAGLSREDHGEVTVYDSNGGRFQAYREHFRWVSGIHVRDWRYISRLANIDTSLLLAGATYDLQKLLIETLHLVRRGSFSHKAIYCTEGFATALDVEANNKNTTALGYREYAGAEVLHFRDWPIRVSDSLAINESLAA